MPNNVPAFLENVRVRLLANNWQPMPVPRDVLEFILVKESGVTVVTTKYVIALISGDLLTKKAMLNIVNEMHMTMRQEAKGPLFPVVTILVFVFEKMDNHDWIFEEGKKLDMVKSNFTVPWVVNISNGILKKHKGIPKITSGESEINAALRSISSSN